MKFGFSNKKSLSLRFFYVKNNTMTTSVKKPAAKQKIDVRTRIKPRGLRGMFKGRIVLNGTDEEVFGLTLTTNVE